jgi:glycosyltransferase involved in cell wall biosynthesis
MKIGIHNEPSGGTVGGSECCVAVLAEALGGSFAVDIIHHRPTLTRQQLEAFSGTDLGAVRLRYVPPAPGLRAFLSRPWRFQRASQRWQADLTRPYDVFLTFTHGIPPLCHAPQGVLVVLFPFEHLAGTPPWKDPRGAGTVLWGRLCGLYRNRGWEERLASYPVKVAISDFVALWAKRRWGIGCTTIYPPAPACPGHPAKGNVVLSVGRFTTQGHGKKQREMVTAFGQLREAGLSGWEFFCVGGLSDRPGDRRYFEAVRRLGLGYQARVLANVEPAHLQALYGQAKVFWHAAGYGDPEGLRPELAEHFGIATVEAMAAGCVPVVINKGAQPEIVEHGVSGFVWNTLEELTGYTRRLAQDEPLWARMSGEARARARLFSRENFVRSYSKVLRPALPDLAGPPSPAPAEGMAS